MTKDRFRPDAALRGIIPFSSAPATVMLRQSGGQIAEVLTGKRGDRVLIDDPHCKPGGVTEEERNAARALFEDRGTIAGVGRNSIPRSHRGEGFNYVD